LKIIVEGTILVLGTAALTYISRASLVAPRSHGFARFFAWEILLAMFLINMDDWFSNPLSWHQLVSWTLLLVSLVLVIQGVGLLRKFGRLYPGREETPMLAMEKTSRLVTSGVYGAIRHPLYSSLLFLDWGIFFKSPSWLEAGLALLCALALYITARVEERENIAYFGEEYVRYMRKSKMFVPFLW
jgi:protein-S-isoprenylcysteine O-methyltransferase Ste14